MALRALLDDPRRRLALLAGAALLIAAAFRFVPPIPQDPGYHNFADTRTILGIPNFWNVVSNLPFAIAGFAGLLFLAGQHAARSFESRSERWAYLVFFASLILTAMGSSYYHLYPGNDTLVWDRIPISMGVMALFAAVIAERIEASAGIWLLVPLVALGVGSVLLWHWTEMRGAGDLRLYAVVQFFPTLAIPFMVLFFPSRYSHGSYMLILVGFYAMAKALEYFDRAVFSAGGIVSGHTLKHIAAAVGTFWILQMLRVRVPSRGEPVTKPNLVAAT